MGAPAWANRAQILFSVSDSQLQLFMPILYSCPKEALNYAQQYSVYTPIENINVSHSLDFHTHLPYKLGHMVQYTQSE